MQLRSCSVTQARPVMFDALRLTDTRRSFGSEAFNLSNWEKFCCFEPNVCRSGSPEKLNLWLSALIAHLATLAVSFSMSHRYNLTWQANHKISASPWSHGTVRATPSQIQERRKSFVTFVVEVMWPTAGCDTYFWFVTGHEVPRPPACVWPERRSMRTRTKWHNRADNL